MVKFHDDILPLLAEILGEAQVVSNPENTAVYTRDHSFSVGKTPYAVVFPSCTAEVQAIVRLANEHRIPVVPRSSPVGLHGAGIPHQRGILIDLKRMNQIIEIDERNWYAVIEPGVGFLDLHRELESRGFRPAKPFLDPPSASVVSSYMERNPSVTAADFTYGGDHVISYTVVSPTGETFTVGHPPLENTPASAPDGPGLNFYRIFQGAQGTLGIVTRMIVRVLPVPKRQKVFFFPCSSLPRTVEVIRRVQKYELGLECFAMNRLNWSAMALEESTGRRELLEKGEYIGNRIAVAWDSAQITQFDELKKSLPAWGVAICLSAVGPIPDEKIAYQEIDLREVAAKIGAEFQAEVEGVDAFTQLIGDELGLSRRMQKRFGYKGSCRQIFFFAKPDRVEEFYALAADICEKHHYPYEEIGFYLLPMERARAFYCSIDLHLCPEDPEESRRIEVLYDRLSEKLIQEGAFFDRPYGKWARSVYSRSGAYASYLKKIKRSIDPNDIMNPGKLCY